MSLRLNARVWGPANQSRVTDADDLLPALARGVAAEALSFLRAGPARGSRHAVHDWKSVCGGRPPDAWSLRDLAEARDESRRLKTHNEYAIGGVRNRVNYSVRRGFTYEVQSLDPRDPVDPADLESLNRYRRAVEELNDFPALERKAAAESDWDGEAFFRVFDDPSGVPQVRYVHPECVYPPRGDDDPWHAMGVVTSRNDRATVAGYFIGPAPGLAAADDDSEFVPESEVVHVCREPAAGLVRGVPVYYPVFDNLRRVELQLPTMSTTSRARMKIALIEQIDGYTPERAADDRRRLLAETGGREERGDAGTPHTVMDLPDAAYIKARAGRSYVFPNASIGASDGVAVLQADLRAVGLLLNMPEWMFTGVANEKYANAFVAEAPTRAEFEGIQSHLAARFGEGRYRHRASVLWRCFKLAEADGRFPRSLLSRVKIVCTPPSLEVRDPQQDASVNTQYLREKVLDKRTVRERIGEDHAEIEKRLKAEAEQGESGRQQQGREGGDEDDANPLLAQLLAGTAGRSPAAEARAWALESLTQGFDPREWDADALAVSDVLAAVEARDLTGLVKVKKQRKDGHWATYYVSQPKQTGAFGARVTPDGPDQVASRATAQFKAAVRGDPAAAATLAIALKSMTVPQIKAIRDEYGLKAGGRVKQNLVDSVAAAARELGDLARKVHTPTRRVRGADGVVREVPTGPPRLPGDKAGREQVGGVAPDDPRQAERAARANAWAERFGRTRAGKIIAAIGRYLP